MFNEYVYIDDSGDAGLNNSASNQLIIAAVIVVNNTERQALEDTMNDFRNKLGWIRLHEFTFNKTRKDILVDLIGVINNFNFKAYIVVLNKSEILPESVPKGNFSIYNHVLKELLIKVGKSNQLITIDGRNSKKHDKRSSVYLRQYLKEKGIINTKIRFMDSRKCSLIQLADIFAGAVARTYKEKTDSQVYINLLKDKIIEIKTITL